MMFTMMGLSAPPPRNGGPRLEIYGPLGLRAHLRTTLATCYASLSSNYVVHELLWPDQPAYPHELPPEAAPVFRYVEGDPTLPEGVRGQERILPLMPPHANELPGRNIRMDPATCTWPDVATLAFAGNVHLSAAPITHRCPAIGYVFQEPPSASQSISPRDLAQLDSNTEALFHQQGIRNPRVLLKSLLRDRTPLQLPDGTTLHPPALDRPGRKLCILGDTSDASADLVAFDDAGHATEPLRGMLHLARDADLLVHECTYASMRPEDVALARTVSDAHALMLTANLLDVDEAETRAVSRGHSTPRIVGTFAGKIGARNVALNHFSARIPAPYTATHAPLTSESQLAQNKHYEESVQRFHVMREIERQVTRFWHDTMQRTLGDRPGASRATAAYDGLVLDVAPRPAASS